MIKIPVPYKWLIVEMTPAYNFYVSGVELDHVPLEVQDTFRVEILDHAVEMIYLNKDIKFLTSVFLVFDDDAMALIFKLTYLDVTSN